MMAERECCFDEGGRWFRYRAGDHSGHPPSPSSIGVRNDSASAAHSPTPRLDLGPPNGAGLCGRNDSYISSIFSSVSEVH